MPLQDIYIQEMRNPLIDRENGNGDGNSSMIEAPGRPSE